MHVPTAPTLSALARGFPLWADGDGCGTCGFNNETVAYFLAFLACGRDHHGIAVDYLGLYNEVGGVPSTAWIMALRAAMDAAGHNNTQLVLPDLADLTDYPALLARLEAEPALSAAVPTIGLHYVNDPAQSQSARVARMRKDIWATEVSVDTSAAGGLAWGALLNQNFVLSNMTSSVSWALVWGVYEGLPYSHRGILDAVEPWSGHYQRDAVAIWAMAQTCQFVNVGWRLLTVAGGGSGVLELPGSNATVGTYVTYVSPGGGDFTVVFETTAMDPSAPPAAVRVRLQGALAAKWGGKAAARWQTGTGGAGDLFAGPTRVAVSEVGELDVALLPGKITTVSTTTGQRRGGLGPVPPPPSAPFPINYSTGFEERAPGDLPLYFSDQGGSFAVARASSAEAGHAASDRGQVLQQMVPVHPVTGMGPAGPVFGPNPLPATVIGDATFDSLRAAADARMPAGTGGAAFAVLCGRVGGGYNPDMGGNMDGDCLNVTAQGAWSLTRGAPPGGVGNVAMHGRASPRHWDSAGWHRLELGVSCTHTAGWLDGVPLFNVSCGDGCGGGYVGLGSSYDPVQFDNFTMRGVPSPPPPPPAPGGAVVFLPCASGASPVSAGQGWVAVPCRGAGGSHPTAGQGAARLLRLATTDLCASYADATQVRLAKCDPASAVQQWRWDAAVAAAGNGTFIATAAALAAGCPSGSGGVPVGGCCLEVQGNEPGPGTPADLYGCEANGGAPCANEWFTMPQHGGGGGRTRRSARRAAAARFSIVAGSTSFCMTAAGGA